MKSFFKALSAGLAALILRCLIAAAALSAIPAALAQTDGQAQQQPARQNLEALGPVVENFLTRQSAGLPGKISVELGKIDSRVNLAACPVPEAFLPKGNRAWGKITVGIRCTAPVTWTVYVPATVLVHGEYYVAAAALMPGHIITMADLAKTSGELTGLSGGVVTDPNQALGRAVTIPLRPGAALRQDGLRKQNVVHQGETVKVVSNGPGFQISTEAYAMSNGSEGQVVQAKTPAGQVVSGIARSGGIVEINN
ncbi:MAG: flgA [Herbaspirillum sp.]|jgi:flagella basal body P-ring formation protein FlgA|nr:flgA [Herbaspirillum sp.]